MANMALLTLLLGCGAVEPEPLPPTTVSEGTDAALATGPVQVFSVRAQRCSRPTRFTGAAVAIGGNRVVTAFHVVEGALRELEVDGQAASVVGISPERDLAVLEVAGLDLALPRVFGQESPSNPAESWEPAEVENTLLTSPIDRRTVGLARRINLVVNDRDDGTRFERQAFEFPGAVAVGQSGSALETDTGELLGVVVLSNANRGVSYASTVVGLEMIVEKPNLAPVGSCT